MRLTRQVLNGKSFVTHLPTRSAVTARLQAPTLVPQGSAGRQPLVSWASNQYVHPELACKMRHFSLLVRPMLRGSQSAKALSGQRGRTVLKAVAHDLCVSGSFSGKEC